MATRKHTASESAESPDKFRVGQTCALVLNAGTGYQERTGTLVLVVAARRFGHWMCSDPGGARTPEVQPGRRYEIACPWGTWYVEEQMLRAVYDGEELSTWDAFERATGMRVASPARPRERAK